MSNTSSNIKLKGIGIGQKLFWGFFSIIIFLIIAITISFSITNKVSNYADLVVERELPYYDGLLELATFIRASQNQTLLNTLNPSPAYHSKWIKFWSNIDAAIVKVNEHLDAKEKDEFNAIQQNLVLLEKYQGMLFDQNQVAVNKNEIIFNQILPILDAINAKLISIDQVNGSANGLVDRHYKELHSGMNQIISDLNDLKWVEISLLVIITIISLSIAFFSARLITTPIIRAIDVARKIASGERNIDIVVNSNDETGVLLMALSDMQTSIHKNEQQIQMSTNEIIEASHNIVTTLEEVRQSVAMQSSGASEQASSVNEITASIEEIEKSSNQTIQKAKQLGEVAEKTRDQGQSGLQSVEHCVKEMKSVRDKVQLIAQTIMDLSRQTQQVGEITAVVNNLAQQSKMLALNASIEAAKAGDAGKGFSVVAVEVKNLAEQSEQSTVQVQKILEDIRHATEKAVMATEEGTKGVDQGAELIEQTGHIIRNLNEIIHETTIASQQIEAAIRQEGAGIEQITIGMGEINQVTKSFVTSVKQTNEAVTNLSKISKRLKSRVDEQKS